jgi:GNAT superfamily N-acetyltransferase
MTTSVITRQIQVRPLMECELDDADRIMQLAFGTFMALPDPQSFRRDASYVHTRWRANPSSAFAAEVEGKLVGSNFVARWGSFGFFGPLSVDPSYWDQGIAGRLIEPVIEALDKWGVTHAGLFTFANSAKHIGLYEKFGFRPRSLTLVLTKDVTASAPAHQPWAAYSGLDKGQQSEALAACRLVTDEIYPGLDPSPEIESICEQELGETVLVWNERSLVGFAACHTGLGTEAGSGTCYVKFAAAAPGRETRLRFGKLLEACEAFARAVGATRLVAGVNAARSEAYEDMVAAGFRIWITGVSMHRPNEAGFSRPGVFVIDDWR